MKCHVLLGCGLSAAALICVGCSVSAGGGGGGSSTRLLSVSGVSIPEGDDALAFVFNAEADRRVTVTVTANIDLSDPDIQVVIGNVSLDELDEVPIGDLVLTAQDRNTPQESGSFTPDTAGDYTLFITDHREWPTATFSISVTQRD